MAKVLYISYDGLSDPLGQAQILPYLTGLAQEGHEISIISCEKHSSDSIEYKTVKEICVNNNLDWHPDTYHQRPAVISTIYDLLKLIKASRYLVAEKSIDIVHCRSYIAALAGLHLKKSFGIKFLFDMRGFWVDERVDGQLWNMNNVFYRWIFCFFKKKEKEMLKNSDEIISLTSAAKKIMLSWNLDLQEEKINVIPCCVDVDLFQPKNNNSERRHRFTLLYLGSIGTWYMLDEMLSFFKVLKGEIPEAKFLFATKDNPQKIKKIAIDKAINPEDIDVRFIERKELPNVIEKVDLAIYFIKPLFSKKASSPTKLGELLSMRLPVITNKGIGDVDDYFENNKLGILIDGFSDIDFQHAVSDIGELGNLDRDQIRTFAKSQFSLLNGVMHYHRIYDRLLL